MIKPSKVIYSLPIYFEKEIPNIKTKHLCNKILVWLPYWPKQDLGANLFQCTNVLIYGDFRN